MTTTTTSADAVRILRRLRCVPLEARRGHWQIAHRHARQALISVEPRASELLAVAKFAADHAEGAV